MRGRALNPNRRVLGAGLNRGLTHVHASSSLKLAIAGAALILVSCGRDVNPDANTKKLRATVATLTLANPLHDLDRALQAGDRRFVCIFGYSTSAPGLEEADRMMLELHGQKCLEGTSDAIESSEHDGLNQQALEYARQYNLELLRRIRHSVVT